VRLAGGGGGLGPPAVRADGAAGAAVGRDPHRRHAGAAARSLGGARGAGPVLDLHRRRAASLRRVRLHQSRKRDGPAEFLAGYEGYLQADAYGAYDGIYAGSSGKIIEVACWSHCRRYWWDARESAPTPAHTALGYIGRLFQLEQELASLSADERRDARQRHALPILREFEAWQQEQQKPERAPLPKSPLAKALTYTRNQWPALCRYCEDGRLKIDNNLSERTVKIPAIGRKNWLFVASEEGGRRAAVLFSLVASAKYCQVEPWAWLRDVFFRLPTIDPADPAALDALLPEAWLAAHPEHRWQIDDLRRAERQRNQTHRRQRRRRQVQ
jgi:hypothetical protein